MEGWRGVNKCLDSDFDEDMGWKNLKASKHIRLSRLDGRYHLMQGMHVKRCRHCGRLVGGNVKYSTHNARSPDIADFSATVGR